MFRRIEKGLKSSSGLTVELKDFRGDIWHRVLSSQKSEISSSLSCYCVIGESLNQRDFEF